METTSTPWPVTPSAKAGGERRGAVTHVVADDDSLRRRIFRAEQTGHGGADIPHDRVVELLADDAANVVGLHDAAQVGHGKGPYMGLFR
jgi:hypothetical protein